MGAYTGKMKTEVLLATRPLTSTERYGLITIQCEIPLFVWTELLTHRLFARNASSGRAMSVQRYTDMGYYKHPRIYQKASGMQASNQEIHYPLLAKLIIGLHWKMSVCTAGLLDRLGAAKEVSNRVIPPLKYVRGIVTGTEYAWANFLRLRNHPAADTAMQEFARMVQGAIERADWKYGQKHTPLYPYDLNPEPMLPHNYYELQQIAAARIARVSYARAKGKNDMELAGTLLKDGHLSPFEHIAEWKTNPKTCAFNVLPTDKLRIESQIRPDQHYSDYGWQSWRTELECYL